MRTSFAPKTCVPRIFAGSRSAGTKIQALNPLRAACAATEFARFPVEEHATVSKPKLRACARATATTRSLKLSVGRQTASFLIHKFVASKRMPRRSAGSNGVKPTGKAGENFLGKGSNSAYR